MPRLRRLPLRPRSACASSRTRSSRRGPTTSSAPTSSGTSPRACCGARSSGSGIDYRIAEGDGAFYGPKIDLLMDRRARPLLADGDDPARRADAGAASAAPTWAPTTASTRRTSSTARCFGSLERFIGILHRALRRRLPVLARAGAGARAAGGGGAPRRRAQTSPSACAMPATASRSPSRRRRSASGSAPPSSRRSRSRSSTATARATRASRCASAAASSRRCPCPSLLAKRLATL